MFKALLHKIGVDFLDITHFLNEFYKRIYHSIEYWTIAYGHTRLILTCDPLLLLLRGFLSDFAVISHDRLYRMN